MELCNYIKIHERSNCKVASSYGYNRWSLHSEIQTYAIITEFTKQIAVKLRQRHLDRLLQPWCIKFLCEDKDYHQKYNHVYEHVVVAVDRYLVHPLTATLL